ncbi:hypothetical protein [Sinorhizobium mexicanum]|uniref:hypothetical protein n=1 Tax=Sinorhizobium mexicanum TaxID=375549 RepID=UPI003CC91C69
MAADIAKRQAAAVYLKALVDAEIWPRESLYQSRPTRAPHREPPAMTPVPCGRMIGYARVSADDQATKAQEIE